jgi:hypothetical protein
MTQSGLNLTRDKTAGSRARDGTRAAGVRIPNRRTDPRAPHGLADHVAVAVNVHDPVADYVNVNVVRGRIAL